MSKILLPIKELAKAIGEIAKAITSLPNMFKHTATGKYSARRSISGVLVIAAAADMNIKGDITTNALILAFIAVLPLIFLSFNKER
jgi:hypothetical protein